MLPYMVAIFWWGQQICQEQVALQYVFVDFEQMKKSRRFIPHATKITRVFLGYWKFVPYVMINSIMVLRPGGIILMVRLHTPDHRWHWQVVYRVQDCACLLSIAIDSGFDTIHIAFLITPSFVEGLGLWPFDR